MVHEFKKINTYIPLPGGLPARVLAYALAGRGVGVGSYKKPFIFLNFTNFMDRP